MHNDKYFQKIKIDTAGYHLFNNGLLLSYGDEWSNQRNIISHSFHYDALKDRFSMIKRVVE